MRVLILFPRPLNDKYSVGGVAEFLCALSSTLNNVNVEPIIYAGDKKEKYIKEAKDTLVSCKVFTGPFLKPNFFYSRKLIREIIKLCRQENITLIHAQGTYTAGFMALQIFKTAKIPYVITSHGDILPSSSKRITRPHVIKRCREVLTHAAKITHLTPMMADISNKIYDTKEKNVIIGNGIHFDEWQNNKESNEKSFLLSIGRLEIGKGFHILIDAYYELLKKNVVMPLVIAGSGKKELSFQEQVRKLGINLVTDLTDINQFPDRSIIFTGYVRGELKKRLMALSKIILFAQQPALCGEAYGIVQLEAMAAGKPLIASESEISIYLQKKGLHCHLVSPDDPRQWEKAIFSLLQDEAACLQMGKANRDSARYFDWFPIVTEYANVYRACVNNL